ncbi:hypothetical protein BB558_007466 [Smittium angustum]|uniref:Uncharacterized protein n=1 Tax=Smittium angustum TaxID=133377 RepID=A0A2U1IUX5_SMIAN|nr:hypothetical protein BB558_007466 [Smittium angustum]
MNFAKADSIKIKHTSEIVNKYKQIIQLAENFTTKPTSPEIKAIDEPTKTKHSSRNISEPITSTHNYEIPSPQENNTARTIKQAILNDDIDTISTLCLENHHILLANSEDGVTALMLACYCSSFKLVKWLCQRKYIDLDTKDSKGNTAMHYAAYTGSTKATEILIIYGANINIPNNDNITPFQIACYHGNPDLVRFMIAVGQFKIDNKDITGKTALMVASYNGKYSVVDILLKKNFRTKSIDKSGWTALMFAIAVGQIAVCKQLLDHDLDKNTISKKHQLKAIKISRIFAHKEISDILEEFNTKFLKNELETMQPLNQHDIIPKILVDKVTINDSSSKISANHIPNTKNTISSLIKSIHIDSMTNVLEPQKVSISNTQRRTSINTKPSLTDTNSNLKGKGGSIILSELTKISSIKDHISASNNNNIPNENMNSNTNSRKIEIPYQSEYIKSNIKNTLKTEIIHASNHESTKTEKSKQPLLDTTTTENKISCSRLSISNKSIKKSDKIQYSNTDFDMHTKTNSKLKHNIKSGSIKSSTSLQKNLDEENQKMENLSSNHTNTGIINLENTENQSASNNNNVLLTEIKVSKKDSACIQDIITKRFRKILVLGKKKPEDPSTKKSEQTSGLLLSEIKNGSYKTYEKQLPTPKIKDDCKDGSDMDSIPKEPDLVLTSNSTGISKKLPSIPSTSKNLTLQYTKR